MRKSGNEEINNKERQKMQIEKYDYSFHGKETKVENNAKKEQSS